MIDDRELARLSEEYRTLIAGPSPESRLLSTVPWYLGWPAEAVCLVRCLQHEVDRFVEVPCPATFSIIAPLRDATPRWLDDLILSLRLQSWLRWELILVDAGQGLSRKDPHRHREGEPPGEPPIQARQEPRPPTPGTTFPWADDTIATAREWTRRDRRIRLVEVPGAVEPAEARDAAVEASEGEFVGFVDSSSLLHPCALGILGRHLAADHSINLVYSNEAEVDAAAERVVRFLDRPPLDLFTLLRTNSVGRLAMIRRDLLLAAVDFCEVPRPRHPSLLDHDLMIRVAASGRAQAEGVPFFLHYRRVATGLSSCDEVPREDREAWLKAWLARIYPGMLSSIASPPAETGQAFPAIRLRLPAGDRRPTLLAIVLFRDEADLTLRCLESIERQNHELSLEVLLVDNRSQDPATTVRIRSWLAADRRNGYRRIQYDRPFNYGQMHNALIAEHGRGRDLVLFLNNDVELISEDCLQTMAMHLMADASCGFVGIRLLYPGGLAVQHGGIKVCDGRTYVCGFHPLGHASSVDEYVNDERVAMGVTFACAMTRRSTFETLGGLDEVLMPNAYGDVDLCLRAIEAGLWNHYFGTLVGIHHESRTRGRSVEDAEFVALYRCHGAELTRWRLGGFASRELADGCRPVGWPPDRAEAERPVLLPLRYRIVDRIHGAVKRLTGPVRARIGRTAGTTRGRGGLAPIGPTGGRRAAGRGVDGPAADEGPEDDR
ncbi:MAG: glycosyltransferase family 2 protein [Isosphaeraceae bacterium]